MLGNEKSFGEPGEMKGTGVERGQIGSSSSPQIARRLGDNCGTTLSKVWLYLIPSNEFNQYQLWKLFRG